MNTKKIVDGYDLTAKTQDQYLCDIGSAIRDFRVSKGLSQTGLGQMVGLGKAQISRIESSENPTVATVSKLLNAMGAQARVHIERSEELGEAYIEDTVELVFLCARRYSTTPNKAYRYLKLFGGLEFFSRYFELEQQYDIEETLEHMLLICRRNGGKI